MDAWLGIAESLPMSRLQAQPCEDEANADHVDGDDG